MYHCLRMGVCWCPGGRRRYWSCRRRRRGRRRGSRCWSWSRRRPLLTCGGHPAPFATDYEGCARTQAGRTCGNTQTSPRSTTRHPGACVRCGGATPLAFWSCPSKTSMFKPHEAFRAEALRSSAWMRFFVTRCLRNATCACIISYNFNTSSAVIESTEKVIILKWQNIYIYINAQSCN